ncbi:MAG: hypothetical protein PHE09_09675 [Oscillospiraceae bacterium]|nr:hypothetical protein [Oscillospiraceae bacterium]
MKRMVSLLLAALLVALLLAACSAKEDNIVFKAEITAINDASIEVTTADDVGFDKATVSYVDDMEPTGFNLIVGQKVCITALPEIRETYPVQITAVFIELAN